MKEYMEFWLEWEIPHVFYSSVEISFPIYPTVAILDTYTGLQISQHRLSTACCMRMQHNAVTSTSLEARPIPSGAAGSVLHICPRAAP